MTSSPNSFLSAPTPAGSVLTPANTTSSRDPSIRTAATNTISTNTSTSTSNPTAGTTAEPSTTKKQTTTPTGFTFPGAYNWPPFFTLQPNASTRLSQLRKWSSLIQAWCRHHRIFRLSLVDAVETPLFHNTELRKRIGLSDARTIVDWMTKSEEEGGGGRRAEWVPPKGSGDSGGAGAIDAKTVAWIWWRRPEEWAMLIADWVGSNHVLRLWKEI